MLGVIPGLVRPDFLIEIEVLAAAAPRLGRDGQLPRQPQ